MHLYCEICMELMTPSEDVRTTTCGHLFHYNCVSQWFSLGHRTCPHCRQMSSSLNFQKIFLTCVNEDRVHLDKNCDAAELKENLLLAAANLDTLKEDFERVNHENQELQLKLLSMEEFYARKNNEIGDTIKELELKLSLALIENDGKDDQLKQNEEKIIFLEESLQNPQIEEDSQNEILSLKLILEEKEKLLIKANENITKLELLQHVLIKNNTIFRQNKNNTKENTSNSENSDVRNRHSYRKNRQNGKKNSKVSEKSIDKERRTIKENINENKNENTAHISKKKTTGDMCEIPEELVGAILSKWELKQLKSKSNNNQLSRRNLVALDDEPW